MAEDQKSSGSSSEKSDSACSIEGRFSKLERNRGYREKVSVLQKEICDTIKGNESLVKRIQFLFSYTTFS